MIRYKILKNGPSKICGRQSLKNFKRYGLPYHFTSNFLKAVFHKFYMLNSWILCPISWILCLHSRILWGGPYLFKFFKGCLPQILLAPFLSTLSHIFHQKNSREQDFLAWNYNTNRNMDIKKNMDQKNSE